MSLAHPRLTIAAAALFAFAVNQAALASEEQESALWKDLRFELYEERPIADGAGIIALEAPYRAQDAAIVPITMTAEIPQSPDRYIKTITLVIDQNPAPIAAVFHMGPASGSATIATRVRIDAYTDVRAIAELNDGSLYMAKKFVKASGGCSAPALKDQDAAMARLGKMKLKQMAAEAPDAPRQAQLLISHPNHSGLQRDPLTLYYIPAHFVQDIKVDYAGETLLTVEGAISLSEDPSIHFSFLPQADGEAPGEFSVWVRDTEDNTFESSWPVEGTTGS